MATCNCYDDDVITGRGRRSTYHHGNITFRGLIDSHLDKYNVASNEIEREVIVFKIMTDIKSKGGRFLMENEESGAEEESWIELSTRDVKKKIKVAFRDARNRTTKRRRSYSTPGKKDTMLTVSRQVVADHQEVTVRNDQAITRASIHHQEEEEEGGMKDISDDEMIRIFEEEFGGSKGSEQDSREEVPLLPNGDNKIRSKSV